MSPRPITFVSSVSGELGRTRKHVAQTLHTLGYDPKSEDTAPTDAGDLLGILRKWIDQSDYVIQLVGHCYRLALQEPHPEFGPCSHSPRSPRTPLPTLSRIPSIRPIIITLSRRHTFAPPHRGPEKKSWF